MLCSRGKTVSSVETPNGGVPQANVSGPSNFITFINYLTTIAPIYKYVDDSTIFEVCHEGDNTQIQESVDMVGIWTNQNDMRLNSEKYKEMIKLMRKGSNQQNRGFIVGCYESVGLNIEQTKASSRSLAPPDSF